jgi:hypothetical protein
MSTTTYEKYYYKFFTDKWMFLVVAWFYVVIRYNLLPNIITDVYIPFIICFIKFLWTRSSSIKVFKDSIRYKHKELATYFNISIDASTITSVYFKVLFFSITDNEFCLIEYKDKKGRIKELLINLDRFQNPERLRASILSFCKNHKIKIIF